MRTFLLPLLALAALALAAPGLAKEPKSATVCGPDGCATTNDSRQLLNLIADNGTTPPPPPAGEYYKVTMTIDVPPDAGVAPKVEWWYTASGGGLLRAVQKDPSGVTAWYPLTATGTAFMERLTRDVKPFPLPRVTSATIGGKPVADPSSYLALFGQETTGSARVAAGDWQDIVFSGPASPWTDNAVTLQYSPSADAILRGYEIAKLPPSLAAKVESGSSLAPGSSFRWWLVGLAALVLAAAAAVVALRRLPRGRALAKRLALPLFLLGALALVPAALAKEPKQATVCGPDGCATTTDGRALTSFVTRSDTGPPPPPGAYYRMTVTIDVPPDAGSAPTFDWWYVPSANMVYRTGIFGEGQENWVRPTPAAAALLERTVRDLAPFPTPEPTRVVVGGRTVDDPASYLRLFTQGSVGHRIPSAGDWQTIRFFGPNSPWTDGSLALSYSKHDGLLLRGGEVITLPTSLVDRIAAGSSLGGTGRTLPWTLLAAVAVALALVASGLLALRRRSPRGLQRPFGRPAGSAG
jgi:hypothetical protein